MSDTQTAGTPAVQIPATARSVPEDSVAKQVVSPQPAVEDRKDWPSQGRLRVDRVERKGDITFVHVSTTEVGDLMNPGTRRFVYENRALFGAPGTTLDIGIKTDRYDENGTIRHAAIFQLRPSL